MVQFKGNMGTLALVLATATAGIALRAGVSGAAMIASDNASNYTATSFTNGANGGSGFSPFDIVTTNNNSPPYAGTYLSVGGKNIATSTGTTAGSPNTAKAAFGVYANTPSTTATPAVNVLRDFVASSGSGLGTLRAGQTFSVALQSNGVGGGTNASDGFALQNGAGVGATTLFSLAYNGANATDDMQITDKNGTVNAGAVTGGGGAIPFADLGNGLNASFTLGTSTALGTPYTLTVSPATGNTSFTAPQTYTGTVANSAINQVNLFTVNTSGNGYFNSLAVGAATAPIPEPATLGLLGVGAVALLRKKRRTA